MRLAAEAHGRVDAFVAARASHAAGRVRSRAERVQVAPLARANASATRRARLRRRQADAGLGDGVDIRKGPSLAATDRIEAAVGVQSGPCAADKSVGVAVVCRRSKSAGEAT